MPIYRLLKHSSVQPKEITLLNEAYERTLRYLYLVDRNDPITQMVAEKVIEIGQTGVRDPAEISKLVLKALGVR